MITDLALLDFATGTGAMRLVGLQPGAALAEVVERTGFDLEIADNIEVLEPPTRDELEILRELDPSGSILR